MLYVVIPHTATNWETVRIFTNYAAAEQSVLLAAKGFEREGYSPDWCTLIAYDGIDELLPVFVYFITDSRHLHRAPWPSPLPSES